MHFIVLIITLLLVSMVTPVEAKTTLTVFYTGNTNGQLESCD